MQVLLDRTKSKDRTSKWHPIISKHLYTKLFVCLFTQSNIKNEIFQAVLM